jgi:hypothetical protein
MSKCPVVQAIDEIKGGFDWSGDASNDENTVTIDTSVFGGFGGGSEGDDELQRTCVLEDAVFYITTRKLTFARFKLGNPDLTACQKFYKREFENLSGRDHYDVYVEILEKLHGGKYLYNAFTTLIDLISGIESAVGVFMINSARKGKQFNLTIPSLKILPTIDVAIQVRSDLLQHTMNQIIQYMNKLNVNDLLAKPISREAMNPLPSPPVAPPFAGVNR